MDTLPIEEARRALAERLSPSAMEHCESVARTAESLAQTYGVDTHEARLAGLLHDWAREDGDATLLDDARRGGVEIAPADRVVPYLLHARTGAQALRDQFPGLSEGIIRAVSTHTLGEVEMTDLDRVVYVADMIEPGRKFKGVDKLRAAVGEVSLPELFARAYARSLKHVIQKRKRLHPLAVEVWNATVDETTRESAEGQ